MVELEGLGHEALGKTVSPTASAARAPDVTRDQQQSFVRKLAGRAKRNLSPSPSVGIRGGMTTG